ncbi:MAG: hypothetical protein JWO89_1671 [Verrucomicrobiaceae bacterium]|nr:hypothetical protein [Verrucomicrobiaceae bacterium]
MLSITDPCELKPADVYRQARLVATKTSRASDRNWYRDAFDLHCQWHLWFDGGREVISATFSRHDNLWRPGPVIPLANLTTGENAGDLIGQLLSPTYFGTRPKALGVILHVADEFALAGLAQSPDSTAEVADDLGILRYNLIDDPREVLADKEVSVETASWRLLPLWGAPSGQPRATALALSRSREAFLTKLLAHGEELRLPIRVAVTAAPVEMLAALPLVEPSLAGGQLIVIPYLKYTAVFILTPAGELRSVRSLSHRGNALVPSGLGDIILSMAVSAELTGAGSAAQPPRVLLVSGDSAALQAACKDLEVYSLSRQTIEWRSIDLANHPALEGIPGHRPEFLVYDPGIVAKVEGGGCALARTETFTALWNGWMTQSSFFDTAKLDALYPTLQDLRLLRFSSAFTLMLTIALIACSAFGAFGFFAASNHPSWNLTPAQLKRTEATQTVLQTERRQIDLTRRLLLPRSRAWTTIEFMLQLFPEETAVRLETFNYGMEASRPGPSSPNGQQTEATGLVRTWSFRGLAKPQALELLGNMNSQRWLSAFFERTGKAIGDSSYAPEAGRQLTVTLTQGRNPRFIADARSEDASQDPSTSFQFTFEATISQTITDKDTLALPAEKPF